MRRVEILWEDGDGTPHVAAATLEDKSSGGLCARLNNPIPARSHITLRWGSQQVHGIVTNCRSEKAGYVIGVKRESDENPDQK